MRILLINPNTSADITARMVALAQGMAPAGVLFTGATGRFGARYIASRAAAAVAAHATLDAYAEHGGGADAVLLGCFGDPGLDGLRELASVPVVGMADAACVAACLHGRRFSIVTGGERWGPMLEEFCAARGLRDRLASVRTVAPTGAELAADPAGSRAMLAAACDAAACEDGAEAVILAGAGLAGLAPEIAAGVPVPVLCSLAEGVRTVLAVAAARVAKPRRGSFAPTPAVETVGLATPLAALLGGGQPRSGTTDATPSMPANSSSAVQAAAPAAKP
jgi:Asp/Glu/hydantoin racemase